MKLVLATILALLAGLGSCGSNHRKFSSQTIKDKMEQSLSGYPCVLLLNAKGSVGCSRKKQIMITRTRLTFHSPLMLKYSSPK